MEKNWDDGYSVALTPWFTDAEWDLIERFKVGFKLINTSEVVVYIQPSTGEKILILRIDVEPTIVSFYTEIKPPTGYLIQETKTISPD
jgi:hypothetical protein